MKLRCNNRFACWPKLALAALACGLDARARADDWPFVRENVVGSGVAQSPLPDKPELLWTFHSPGDSGFDATPIVAGGIVYIGDSDGTFNAIRLADGTAVWSKKVGDAGFLAGAAWDDGRLYVGDGNGIVRCFSAVEGSEVWHADVSAEVYAGPMVHDQDVLVTCEAGTLTCFDKATGKERWHFHIEAPLRCTPTIVAGHVLLAGCDSKLHMIDASNGEETSVVAIDAPTGSTAAGRGSRVYFGTEGGAFYGIDIPADAEKPPTIGWTFRDSQRGQPIRSAAAITEKLVTYGAQGKAVFGLNPVDGKRLWMVPTQSRVDSSPVIAADRVVAATDRGVLYLIDAKSGEVKWQFEAGGHFAGSPAVVDGRIVIPNADGTLYCFGAKHEGKKTIEQEKAEVTEKLQ